jgi:hypothetical protein
VLFDGYSYFNTKSSWNSYFNGSSGFNSQTYEINADGSIIINLSDFKDDLPEDTSLIKSMKAVHTKYLYGNINLQQGSGILQDYQYYMITAAPVEYFTSEPAILSDNRPSNFTQFDTSSEAGYGTKFYKGSHEANLTFEFNTENPTVAYNLPIDSPNMS